MKNSKKLVTLKTFIALLIFNFMQLALQAQDSAGSSSTSSTTTTSVSTSQTNDFWTSPWVWVIGGAIFILLLVALLRGNSSRSTAGSSDKVTVTKTVRRDTDTDV